MTMAYNVMKVFDCQDMPKQVLKAFWTLTEQHGNDCYVSRLVGEYNDCDEDTIVDEWLFAGGATKGEKVIIRHWW